MEWEDFMTNEAAAYTVTETFLDRLKAWLLLAIGVAVVLAMLLITYGVAVIKNDEAAMHTARQGENVQALAAMLARIRDGSIARDRIDDDAHPFGEWSRGMARNLSISHAVVDGRLDIRVASIGQLECRHLGLVLDGPVESIAINGGSFASRVNFDPSLCEEDARIKVSKAATTTAPANVIVFRLKPAR